LTILEKLELYQPGRGKVDSALVAVLAGYAIGAAAVVIWATPWGVGLSPDSAVYIAGARTLAELKGYAQPGDGYALSPIVHYPPAYSASLAVLRIVGWDPFDAARWLNALLFGSNAILVGYLVYGIRRRWSSAATAAALMITAYPLVQTHTMAWSEPLFIFLELCVWLCLLNHSRFWSPGNLIGAGIAAGLAALARYVGIAVILAGGIALLILICPGWKRRITQLLVFLFCSVLPVVLWVGRNWWISGSATNRTMGFHIIDFERIVGIFTTISTWFVGDWLRVANPALVLCLAGLVVFAIALQRRNNSVAPATAEADYLNWLMLLFLVCYFGVLLVSISLLDDQTPIDTRILAPIYPVLLLLGFGIAAGRSREERATETKRWLSWGAILLLVGLQAAQSWPWLRHTRTEGVGYASRMWRESSLLRQVKTLESSAVIYSNAPDVLYTLIGRAAYMLPRKTRPDAREPNSQFSAQIGEMEAKLKSSRGVIVYFDRVRWRRYLPDGEELEARIALRVLRRVSDGTIYAVE